MPFFGKGSEVNRLMLQLQLQVVKNSLKEKESPSLLTIVSLYICRQKIKNKIYGQYGIKQIGGISTGF